MLTLNGLSVRQFSPSFTTVSWAFAGTTESLSDYTGNLYRSELPSQNIADYALVVSGLNFNTTFQYNDSFVSGLTNKFSSYTYMLEISGLLGQGVVYSAPVEMTVASDNVAVEVVRQKNLILTRFSGEPFKVLREKTYGQYCTYYDFSLQQCTKGKTCPVCYGTNFIGGYYSPYTILGQLNTQPRRSVITTFGDWKDGDALLETTNVLSMKINDIVVDLLGRRWLVNTVQNVNKAMFVISQRVQLRLLDTVDATQNIPVVNVTLADSGQYSSDPNYGISNIYPQ